MTDVDRQRRALREGALVQPAPELGTLVITGSERQSWLDGLVTCELKGKHTGEGAFGLSVAKTGKIQAELWIVLGPDRLVVGARRDRIGDLQASFDRHLIMEDAELGDASADRGWILVHGPRSQALVEIASRHAGALGAPIDRTGLGGAAISLPSAEIDAVTDALLADGGDAAALASPEGWSALRVELMVPEVGVDYDDQTYPQEASLERAAVSFSKGCYLGQEAVFMLEHRGHVKRKLVQLRIDGTDDVAGGSTISAPDGTVLGQITSRSPDPAGAGTLALGWVKYKHAVTGTDVRVAGRAARVTLGRAPS